jgi:hypothetical protein
MARTVTDPTRMMPLPAPSALGTMQALSTTRIQCRHFKGLQWRGAITGQVPPLPPPPLLRPPRQPLRRPPGERVEGSDRRRRRALAGGGDSSQVEGRDRRWRRAIAGEGITGREQICDSGSGDRDSDRDCSPPVTQAAAATVTSQPELTSW